MDVNRGEGLDGEHASPGIVWFPNPLAAGSFVFQSQMGTLSTFHLVLTISNVFQKMYRIVGGETEKSLRGGRRC